MPGSESIQLIVRDSTQVARPKTKTDNRGMGALYHDIHSGARLKCPASKEGTYDRKIFSTGG